MGLVLNLVCRPKAILPKWSPVSHMWQAFSDGSLRNATIQPTRVPIGCGSNQLHANTVWSSSVGIGSWNETDTQRYQTNSQISKCALVWLCQAAVEQPHTINKPQNFPENSIFSPFTKTLNFSTLLKLRGSIKHFWFWFGKKWYKSHLYHMECRLCFLGWALSCHGPVPNSDC